VDHLIYDDGEAGTARLTEDPGVTPCQAPVLRIERGELRADFGPGDILADPWSGEPSGERAADVVFAWATDPQRTAEERRDADRFLRQWSTGPQLKERSQSLPGDDNESLPATLL
jgi:hypothetical protein